MVVSLADWEAARAGRADKWARANAMLADLHERMREDGMLDRLKDVDWAEVIRDGRAQRDQQVWDGDPRLHLRALELAGEHNLSATYDAHYLALAERFRAPLWTGDRRLTNKLHGDVPVVHLVP